MKILFIAGNGRSGSTLLNVLLGQVPGFFAVGELRRIWDRGLIENRPCGCGLPFQDCPVWDEIFKIAYGGKSQMDALEMIRLREKYSQTKHLAGMYLGRDKSENRERKEFVRALGHLYDAIHSHSGCRVIVDASKWPMYARYVEQIPSVQMYVLHLVRDPRACAFSWSRIKEYEPGVHLPQQNAFRSTAYWVTWNPSISHFWKQKGGRYLFLPYEKFVDDPQSGMRSILAFLGEDADSTSFLNGKKVTLHPTHSVAGNIARLTRGELEIKPDHEWETGMSQSSRVLVSAMTWPWLLKYGYVGRSQRTT